MTKEQHDLHYAWLGLFVVLGSCWRAWFGGSFGYCWRWIKYLVLFGIVLGMYYLKRLLDWYAWRMYAVCITYAYHWAMSHGDYFKVNNTDPDEGRVRWIDWLLQLIYGKDNYYNWRGNVTGMLIRYTYTSIFVAISTGSYWAITMGPVVAMTYGLCGKLLPDRWYTKYAEFIAGGLCFGILWSIL